jgi:hypothetical protein
LEITSFLDFFFKEAGVPGSGLTLSWKNINNTSPNFAGQALALLEEAGA